MQQPKKSFEQVLEDNKDKIYRICRIYAIASTEPQDLFQEVVYQAWKSYPSFKGESGEDTWSKISEDTGVGNPREATADKGANYFEAITRKNGKVMIDIVKVDIKNLYP